MEILAFFFVLALVLIVLNVVGYGIRLVLAPIVGKQTKPARSPEADILASFEAIDRLYRGGFLDEKSFVASALALQQAAQKRKIGLPSLPSLALLDQHLAEQTNDVSIAESPQTPSDIQAELATPLRPVKELHALEQEYAPAPPPLTQVVAKESRRALGDILQQFLHEKNIHWGELVSGLLIAGSAVGLILSLRTELNRLIPMFPSVLFFLVTLAIHLAGFYTLKKWKLPSTSRGLLVLGSVMMPVTALATSLLRPDQESSWVAPAQLVPLSLGIVGFGAMSYFSSQSLFPRGSALWCVTLTLSGITPLLIDHFAEQTKEGAGFRWIGLLPMMALGIAHVGTFLNEYRANEKQVSFSLRSELRLFGIATAGLFISFGLLILYCRSQGIGAASFGLAMTLAGVLLASVGAYLSSKSLTTTARDASELSQSMLQATTLIGSIVSLAGAVAFFLALVFSWSEGHQFLLVSLVSTGLAFSVAALWQQPTLTAIACSFGSISAWCLVYWLRGMLPVGALSSEWLAETFPTLMTSITSMGLAICLLAGVLSLTGLRKHGVVLLTNLQQYAFVRFGKPSHAEIFLAFAMIHAVCCFIIAAYLGVVSQSLADLIYAIGCVFVLGLVVITLGYALKRWHVSLIGSALIFAACCFTARTNTALASRLGISDWSFLDASIFALAGHCSCVSIGAGLLHTLKKAGLMSGEDNRTTAFRFMDSGLTTGLIAAPFLVRWDLPHQWWWQSMILAVLGVSVWGMWWVVKETRNFSIASCLIVLSLAFGAGQFLVNQSRLGWLPSTCLAISLSSSIALAIGATIVMSRRTLVISHHFTGVSLLSDLSLDIGMILLIFFRQLHAWLSSFDWGQAIRKGALSDAIVWTISFLLMFLSVCALTAWRKRDLYVWVTGLLSIGTTFMLVVTWMPGGNDYVGFLYLLATAPLMVAAVLAIIDFVRHIRRLGQIHPGSYEFLIGMMSVMAWGFSSLYGLIFHARNPNSSLPGLCSVMGVLWATIGFVCFSFRCVLESKTRFAWLLLLGTLILFLNLPILMVRTFQSTFSIAVYLSLLWVGAALHGLLATLFSIKGILIGRRLLSALGFDVVGSIEASSGLIGRFVIGQSWIIVASSMLFVALIFEGEAIRLAALSVALIGFAGAAIGRIQFNENRVVGIVRYLILLCVFLFVVYLLWSSIESSERILIWCGRVLRLDAVLFALCIALGIASYAWVRGSSGEVQQAIHSESNVALRSMGWITNSSTLSSRYQMVTSLWIKASVATIGMLIFGLIFVVMLRVERKDLKLLSLEVVWILGLTALWIVQLVVQAVHHQWNVARFVGQARSYYVYLAEIVFGLTILLAYFVFPEWFELPFREYWPILILIVAVVGQGIAAILKKAKVETVSQPLFNTSLVLPFAVPMGMLALNTVVPAEVVLALSSIFYFFMGATERSRNIAMVGGILGNIALLFFWRNFREFSFESHPQLWLVPPAASLALATHLNRDRLNPEVASWIRYLSMATIFCSSSSEIIMAGLGKSLWPPMILMVLSLVTAFAGIGLQVRSYLLSGTLFTMFALVAMVAHAQQSVNHTWPWWVLGITLGIGIAVLFGLFERKREEFLQLSERLKRWDG